ncbi:secretion-regulating guanine nucleotide exchange factor [Anaeramoeba ignava]|uniref:Secretion-regulating guanine nucleotide exchange factor n=1 Tax=Anaeramoeba ignava TaxID=1746090 RepID=A0A9Q0RE62_ANAIG|nr:secretion-regulating guanine nucleotide exchange factor [Anaeramoeba ignava]
MNEILFCGSNHYPKLIKNKPDRLSKRTHFKFENQNQNRSQIKQISSNFFSTIFLFENGKAIEHLQNSHQNPHKIPIENIQKVSVSFRNKAILTADGIVFAKGKHFNPNEFINISSLIEDKNDRVIEDIICTFKSIYLLTSNQNAYGTGANKDAQLGISPKTLRKTQKPILMMKNVSKIFSGNNSYHVFLLNLNQELFGCGDNDHGQLGLGKSTKEKWKIKKLTKIQKIPKGKIIDIQCGGSNSLMLVENQNQNPKRKLYSCGVYEHNGLGKRYKHTYKFTEIKSSLFENDDDILDFACGYSYTLILTRKGKLIGFGANDFGQLGIKDTTKTQSIPIQIELPKLRFNENISIIIFIPDILNHFFIILLFLLFLILKKI